MKKLILLTAAIILFSCKNNQSEERMPVEPDGGIGDGAGPPPALTFSENMEEAHNKPAFMSRKAVSFDIQLIFGSQTRLNGTVSMTTNSSKVKLEKADGTTITYNGENVYISPDTTNSGNARFDIFTWQYFFAMPFKLTDPGTVWEAPRKLSLDSLQYDTAKLSFLDKTGDSPDDWYIVYKDEETGRLKAAAYIVTFSKDQKEAEEDPHAIVYSDYKMIEDVAIATQWSFHNWNETEGIGEKLGEASISNIRFFDPEAGYFEVPENSKMVNR